MERKKLRKGHAANLRKGRYSEPNRAYFVTKCVLLREQRPFARPDCAHEVIRSFLWARDQGWFRILGFVVMPDHYHLILGLGEALPLDAVMQRMNGYLGHRITQMLDLPGPFWQKGFYDHAIRDRQDFDPILEYVHANPIYAKLVDSPEQWPFSTANLRWSGLIDWEWLGFSVSKNVRARHRFDPARIPTFYR